MCAIASDRKPDLPPDKAIEHIVILGGGTAGWLTAAILAADHRAHCQDGLRISLIESSTIPIIGVGEGTWPSLRDVLRRIGISETELIRHCNASFKQGSRFDGWKSGASGEYYFHPFDPPPNSDVVDWLALWQAVEDGKDSPPRDFAAAVSHQSALCMHGKAPKQITTPEYAAVANYAYHFDAPAFAALLRTHCTTKLGVRLISDEVIGVRLRSIDSNETSAAAIKGGTGSTKAHPQTPQTPHVVALETRNGGLVIGDIFVDCSGMQAMLIGDALGVAVTDVSDILFNDRALAIQVPYPQSNTPIASQTTGTACSAGWIWDIGLQTRRGVGYVFSSAHSDEASARDVLTSYLARTGTPGTPGTPKADARLLRFQSGYRATPWVGNVVAVGMAQGFVEPLEASAIVMIELSATMVSDTLPTHRHMLATAAARFNARFAYRWQRIVDFLKLHYLISARTEPYWRDHRQRDHCPTRLLELLAQWQWHPPSREDFPQALEIFPAASYAYVLYGMGFITAPRPHYRRKDMQQLVVQHRRKIATRQAKFLAGLPSNRALLDHITAQGLPRG